MDITGYEDRTYGFNANADAFGVAKKRVSPWWHYSNKLLPFSWQDVDVMRGFDWPSMDAPDLLPSGAMMSMPHGGQKVVGHSREWLKTPFEDAIDAAFADD